MEPVKIDFTSYEESVRAALDALGAPERLSTQKAILAGWDARDVDRVAAGLLGLDWHGIRHLA